MYLTVNCALFSGCPGRPAPTFGSLPITGSTCVISLMFDQLPVKVKLPKSVSKSYRPRISSPSYSIVARLAKTLTRPQSGTFNPEPSHRVMAPGMPPSDGALLMRTPDGRELSCSSSNRVVSPTEVIPSVSSMFHQSALRVSPSIGFMITPKFHDSDSSVPSFGLPPVKVSICEFGQSSSD